MAKATHIRVEEVSYSYEDFLFRTPIKFGGVAVDRATLLNVEIEVSTPTGKRARGFGSMPLGNVWSFPSKKLGYDDTLGAMRTLAEALVPIVQSSRDYKHPLDHTWDLEHAYFQAAAHLTQEHKLADPIPKLSTLVVASPFDAALHDAFGKVHGLNCYHTYGKEFVEHDLGHYLGAEYKGLWLGDFVKRKPEPSLPLYHLVGALDPLTDADVTTRLHDGLPNTLAEWIPYNGLTHLKIKLNGDNLAWDIARVLSVNSVASTEQAKRGITNWWYSLDFNERCPNVGYLIEVLRKVQEQSPAGFARIQYVEQPTARDLHADRHNVMHEAAKLKPIVIDESLLDLESLSLAQEMGYTGAALKACKGQTQSLILAAAAQVKKLFLCVQDLTCPGASLLHSAGLAAHVPGVVAIEANARQYVPAANTPFESRFPGIFKVTTGRLETGVLTGPGLGVVPLAT